MRVQLTISCLVFSHVKDCFQQSSVIRLLIWRLGCYLFLVMSRKTPTANTIMPGAVNSPENWLMPMGREFTESNANSAPTIMSINPNSFSMTVNPMGASSLMPEPSRLNFTVPRLILIYLS
jgi:hypothetical protein